jgi:hypothetical protein
VNVGARLDEATPTWVEPEVVGPIRIDLRRVRSSTGPWIHPTLREDDGGPARVRGEMVWLNKTAPTLVIEGGPTITPEEHAAGRRR